MPKLPIFRLRNSEPPIRPDLLYQKPTLAFSDLQLGVDNLRYDVFLSPRICADLSFHIRRYICRFGEVESLFEMEVPSPNQSKFIRAPEGATGLRKPGPADLKSLLVAIHLRVSPPILFGLVGLCAAPAFPVVVSWMADAVPNATSAATYVILGAVIGSARSRTSPSSATSFCAVIAVPATRRSRRAIRSWKC